MVRRQCLDLSTNICVNIKNNHYVSLLLFHTVQAGMAFIVRDLRLAHKPRQVENNVVHDVFLACDKLAVFCIELDPRCTVTHFSAALIKHALLCR